MIGRRDFLGILAGSVLAAPRAMAGAPTWKTLRGPFVQERTLGLFKSVVTSKGMLTLVRPDRMRWELFAPDEIVYFATPEVLAYRSRQGSGRVPASAGRFATSLADVRALLASDVSALRTRYDVHEESSEKGGLLEAVPKSSVKSPFKKITLELAADHVRPTRATLVEGPKDRITITFGELVLDADVDPRSMEPPPT